MGDGYVKDPSFHFSNMTYSNNFLPRIDAEKGFNIHEAVLKANARTKKWIAYSVVVGSIAVLTLAGIMVGLYLSGSLNKQQQLPVVSENAAAGRGDALTAGSMAGDAGKKSLDGSVDVLGISAPSTPKPPQLPVIDSAQVVAATGADLVDDVVGDFVDGLHDMAGNMADLASDTVGEMTDSATDVVDNIADAASSILNLSDNPVVESFNKIAENLDEVAENFNENMESLMETAHDTANDQQENVQEYLENAAESLENREEILDDAFGSLDDDDLDLIDDTFESLLDLTEFDDDGQEEDDSVNEDDDNDISGESENAEYNDFDEIGDNNNFEVGGNTDDDHEDDNEEEEEDDDNDDEDNGDDNDDEDDDKFDDFDDDWFEENDDLSDFSQAFRDFSDALEDFEDSDDRLVNEIPDDVALFGDEEDRDTSHDEVNNSDYLFTSDEENGQYDNFFSSVEVNKPESPSTDTDTDLKFQDSKFKTNINIELPELGSREKFSRALGFLNDISNLETSGISFGSESSLDLPSDSSAGPDMDFLLNPHEENTDFVRDFSTLFETRPPPDFSLPNYTFEDQLSFITAEMVNSKHTPTGLNNLSGRFSQEILESEELSQGMWDDK